MSRQLLRLTRDRTAFLCCDIQSVFQETIYRFPHVVHTASVLVSAAKILNIPVVVSEQYPEKLGHTVADIDITRAHVYSKTTFSMITPDFPTSILRDTDAFVLFGIEAHVCVQQTALDLLEAGKSVVLVTDGVSSSRELDRSTAIQRLTNAGAVLMTAEAIMFEIMRTKECSEFKTISGLAKQLAIFGKSGGSLSSL
jgi:nicotinamidase-related amidase